MFKAASEPTVEQILPDREAQTSLLTVELAETLPCTSPPVPDAADGNGVPTKATAPKRPRTAKKAPQPAAEDKAESCEIQPTSGCCRPPIKLEGGAAGPKGKFRKGPPPEAPPPEGAWPRPKIYVVAAARQVLKRPVRAKDPTLMRALRKVGQRTHIQPPPWPGEVW